ncbi:helix-turn-helix domain-containing protein [beta proteobacterium MWH-UniP1]
MDYPIHFAEQLGQHLRAFRKARGLTQVQLAAHLGVTQSRIADIETNPGKVSLENLLKVFSALDLRLRLEDASTSASITQRADTSATLADLKKKQDQASSEGQDW